MSETDYDARFGGIQRLYGRQTTSRFQTAHVVVVGIGGVGSWTAEALARSGVGRLTLVDLDDLCITNINRQIHALDGSIGQPKVSVMADRIRSIHPGCSVTPVTNFFTAESADSLLSPGFDCMVDAIDSLHNKCLLIAECRRRGLPLVVCGSAGGRIDPTRIRAADLAHTVQDRLLAEVRGRLRSLHGFPKGPGAWDIPAVYSLEPSRKPPAESNGATDSETDPRGPRLNCDSGYGSATFVTGAMGFAAAAQVIDVLAKKA